jgi:leucyl aminopeptidase
MDFVIKHVTKPETQASHCLVVPVYSKGKLSKVAKHLDNAIGGTISAVVKRGDISGKIAETLLLPNVDNIKAERILLLGCGKPDSLPETDAQKLIDAIIKQLALCKSKDACLLLDELSVQDRETSWLAQQLCIRSGLSHYQYDETLSTKSSAPTLKRMTFATQPDKALKNAATQGKAIAFGMNTAKELGNLPGNICTPTYLAQQAKSLARNNKTVTTTIVEEKKMLELGMGALLSVSAGSVQPAKLIVINYNGAAKKQSPHVLVGKGITFDSGGISLKPGARMDEMKYDMCGAASVLGTMTAVAELNLPINVVAIIAAAENMPSGIATKPGDVITSMSGQTIEVLNTDAEGRLVLCDALTYAERFKPKSVIDIATLTGACVVALGKHATAVYSNQDDFAQELLTAGRRVSDKGWHMPLWDEYQPQLKSQFADIANIGGPEAGSVTAACFLSRFAKKYRWAHLDIAGTAWNSGANKGATGRPVGLLTQYLINQCHNG